MSGPILEYEPADDHRAAPRRLTVTLAIIATALGLCIAAGYVLMPSNGVSRMSSPVVQCAGNLQQIGQATMLYANENHDAMPPDFAALLSIEDLVPEVFVCPLTNDVKTAATQPAAIRADFAAGGHCSYVYVNGYAKFSALDPNDVIAFEPFGHHGNETNVLFADGHVERVAKPTADAIQRQYDNGTRPIRVPAGAAQ